MLFPSAIFVLIPALAGGGKGSGPDQRPTIEELIRIAAERAEKERAEIETRMKDLLLPLDLPYEKNSDLLDEKISGIAAMGPKAIPFLLPALDNNGNDDRAVQRGRNCARTIVKIGSPEAIPECLKLLESGTPEGKSNAILVLGGLRAQGAETPLLSFVRSEANSMHRSSAIWALGEIRSETAVGPLAEYLRTADQQTAKGILLALEKIGSPKAVVPVAELIPETYFRPLLPRILAFLLGMGSKDALPHLVKALSLPDLSNSHLLALVQAIGQLGAPSYPPAVPALKPLLASKDKELRDETAYALNDLGDESGVKGLIDPLDDYVREYPRDPLGFQTRGKAYLRLHKYREALRDFKDGVRVSKKEANLTELYVLQARCHAALNQLKEAYNALRATEIDSSLLSRYKDLPEFKALREHEKYGQIFK